MSRATASDNVTADVAIVGGGVAGSSLAAALAGAGLGVVLIERESRFRDRIRGEALHPWGAAEADRLGLIPVLRAAGGQPLPVWQRYERRAPCEPYRWADDVAGGHVEWGISHPALQEALLAHVAGQGARVLQPARADGFRRVPGSGPEVEVDVGGRTMTVRARLVVGADGGRSATRRWLGAATEGDPVHHMIGGCLVDSVALDEGCAHQAYVLGGMVVAFPQGRRRARAYLVCDPERAAGFRGPAARGDFIAACAEALPLAAFADVVPAGPAGFFPGADVWADRLSGNGVVLVGDAAGANDPSRGHGLSLAFRDARELRALLLAEPDWARATAEFATRRAAYFAPLRAHAQWEGILTVDQGPAADARRERVARARELDPTAGGFALIYAFGPNGLVADEAARGHYFGEDLAGGVR